MNKYLILILSTFLSFTVRADQETVYRNLGTGVTNIAANTTNTTAGSIFQFNYGQSPIRLYVKASGFAATTNGSLVIRFSTASGDQSTTNDFDTALLSNIKITITSLQSTTNVVSDWFEPRGARFLRVGAIENNFNGSVSNISVIIGYPR
jgi:hypothetical protein